MVLMNHTTEEADVLEVLGWLGRATIPRPLEEVSPAPAREREPGVRLRWISEAEIDARAVRAVPLFRTLTEEQAGSLASATRRIRVEPGEVLVRQWEGSRDLYVVLDGTARVSDDERVLGEIGPGDVFGEVAALEWGAEFGYARTATVSAVSPMRVMVIPQPALGSLLGEAPEVAEELRRLAQQRLSNP
jgi:signal-transduction protein with cAMP-binding, CBS, and nucleotidyltransferase domain